MTLEQWIDARNVAMRRFWWWYIMTDAYNTQKDYMLSVCFCEEKIHEAVD